MLTRAKMATNVQCHVYILVIIHMLHFKWCVCCAKSLPSSTAMHMVNVPRFSVRIIEGNERGIGEWASIPKSYAYMIILYIMRKNYFGYWICVIYI